MMFGLLIKLLLIVPLAFANPIGSSEFIDGQLIFTVTYPPGSGSANETESLSTRSRSYSGGFNITDIVGPEGWKTEFADLGGETVVAQWTGISNGLKNTTFTIYADLTVLQSHYEISNLCGIGEGAGDSLTISYDIACSS